MTALDLGYGTTWTYLGGALPEHAVVVPRSDGALIPVSERHLRAFAAALVHGNYEAGVRMGVAEQTVKNMLTRLYRRLGVFGKWEAAELLGWVQVPAELLDVPSTGGRPVAGRGGGVMPSPHTPGGTR